MQFINLKTKLFALNH